ncbi:hypothetical protein Tco_0593642 [Tanacetum coccineum]
MCTKMVPEEEDRVEKFIGGLPDNIQGNVIAAEPTRLQDAVRIANNLMDKKLKGYAMKNTENKRRFDNNQKDNRVQQPLYKRQNVGGQSVTRAYMAGNNEKRGYVGPLPYCNKCKLHHEGPCTMKCRKYNKVGNMTRDCMNVGHYRSECPKLKNQTCGNKARKKTDEAKGKAYVLGGGEANPDSNVVTGTFLLNNHYASMLFDSGTDRSKEKHAKHLKLIMELLKKEELFLKKIAKSMTKLTQKNVKFDWSEKAEAAFQLLK